MEYYPSDAEVRRIQEQHGFDYMQAYYHAQGRHRLTQQIEQKRQEAFDRALRELLQS